MKGAIYAVVYICGYANVMIFGGSECTMSFKTYRQQLVYM